MGIEENCNETGMGAVWTLPTHTVPVQNPRYIQKYPGVTHALHYRVVCMTISTLIASYSLHSCHISSIVSHSIKRPIIAITCTI